MGGVPQTVGDLRTGLSNLKKKKKHTQKNKNKNKQTKRGKKSGHVAVFCLIGGWSGPGSRKLIRSGTG